jgi:hypothetical protein
MIIKGMLYVNGKYINKIEGKEYSSEIVNINLLKFLFERRQTDLLELDALTVTIGFKALLPTMFDIQFNIDKKDLPEFWDKLTKKDK